MYGDVSRRLQQQQQQKQQQQQQQQQKQQQQQQQHSEVIEISDEDTHYTTVASHSNTANENLNVNSIVTRVGNCDDARKASNDHCHLHSSPSTPAAQPTPPPPMPQAASSSTPPPLQLFKGVTACVKPQTPNPKP